MNYQKNTKANSVILYDPVDFFPLFLLVAKAKEFEAIAGYILRLLELDKTDRNFFYEGSNGLSSGVFGRDTSSRFLVRDLDAVLKREKFFRMDDEALGKLINVGNPIIVGLKDLRTKFPWRKEGAELKTLEFLVGSVKLN